MPAMTMVQAIQDALRIALREDPRVVVLGEDVGKAGGVFAYSASGNYQGTSFSVKADAGSLWKLNDIVMCKGAPIGGSIYVKGWQTVTGTGQSSANNKAYEATHTFATKTCS